MKGVEQEDGGFIGGEEDLGDINGAAESTDDVLYCSLELDFSLDFQDERVTSSTLNTNKYNRKEERERETYQEEQKEGLGVWHHLLSPCIH